ncbi:MAG TPA: metallophosphoesterase family protein [Gaiellaceae bacterium]|nr:metallophosphoesterase family protein [Gaiellaceae bacterium]
MRYGVLSDVHGNLPALEAVVAALGRERIDAWLCAGDLVGYGASPNECVDRLRALGVRSVAGNHDLVASGRQDESRCGRLALETLRWTKRALRDDVRAYLRELPLHDEPADGVVVAHGSLHDPWRYVARPAAAARELEALAGGRSAARLLVLGHTHAPLAYGADLGARDTGVPVELGATERWLLNPGAVGQSREREPVARGLVLDLDADTARFLAVEYDVEAALAALRRAGLPAAALHEPPAADAGPRRQLLRGRASGSGRRRGQAR